MRRALGCAIAVAVAVGLTGCGGATAPDPSPSPDPVGVYDGVDLAPLLIERPFVGFSSSFEFGPWHVEAESRVIGDLDPGAFADDARCEAALEVVQPDGVEVLAGGYDLQSRFQVRVRVASFATADDATAYLAALDAATDACVGVQGETSFWDADAVIETPVETPLADAAGFATLTLDYDDENAAPSMNLVAAHEELVVVMVQAPSLRGLGPEDPDLVAAMQAQVDALEAARP